MTDPLRFVTFNIRNGRALDGVNAWPFRRRWVPHYVRDLDADVIGLQEAYHNQVSAMERALTGYVRVGVGRDDGKKAGEHCPIFVRSSRLRVMEHGTFWFSDTPNVPGSCTWGNTLPRIATWALLADDHETLLRVCNLHLDHASAQARLKSAHMLVQRAAAWRALSPVVVMGDFNAPETDPVLTTIISAPDGLRDTFRQQHPHAEGMGTFHAWQGRTDGARIDYILATPDLEVCDAAILLDTISGRLPSDHWPVMALLRVPCR